MTDEPHIPFSRRMACDLGKASQDLKTKVDEQTEYLWLRFCAEKNTTTAELLRDFVFKMVHGKTHTRMVAEQKLHEAKDKDELFLEPGLSRAPEKKGDQE